MAYYTTRLKDGGVYQTHNAETAYQWFQDGLLVLVHRVSSYECLYLTRKGRVLKIDPCPKKFEDIADYIRRGYTDDNPTEIKPYDAPPTTFRWNQPNHGLAGAIHAVQQLEDKKIVELPENTRKALRKHNVRRKDIKQIIGEKVIPIKHNLQRLHEYAHSKGIVGSITRLYHGTSSGNIERIIKEGFSLRYARGGMLGRGVYLGTLNKARGYSDGVILVVSAYLGVCKELTRLEHLDDYGNEKYDSLHLPRGAYAGAWGGKVSNDEWVIRDPLLTEVIGIIIKGTR